jgi:hypothetical protein
MARSLIQFYALTVCFATLMCLVVVLGLGGYDLVRIAAPSFTVPNYIALQSNEYYLMYHPDKKDLPEREQTILREKYRLEALHQERHSAQQRFVFVAIIATIDMVVYALHWRLARAAEPLPASR